MSDSPSISLSYSTHIQGGGDFGPAQGENSVEPDVLVAFATCDIVPVDSQMAVLINRENGQQQLASPQVVESLKTCTKFDYIDNHTRRLCDSRPELKNQHALVSRSLEELRRAGLLNEARSVCDRLRDAPPVTPPPTRVFVITADRPACLERLLESLLAAGGITAHESLYLVDDSRRPESRSANADLVARFNTKSARDMIYVGAAEQAALIHALVAAAPEHEAGVRFLLDPHRWQDHASYGRARTLCLLLSVGYRALMLDDDILCRAIAPAVPEAGVFVGGDGRREASFFANRDELMAAAVDLGVSPLDLHARYLGAPVGAAIEGLNGGALLPRQLQGANAAMTSLWNRDSRVLVSQCGAWGDPGTGDAHWTLKLGEYSVSRLLSAPQGVTAAIENRCAWLGAPRPTIVKMAFMSQMTGLDNSALLPPYFPVFRGEDLLFASMVEAMHPHDAVIDHAFAVPHLPEARERKSLRAPIASAGSVGLFSTYLVDRIDYSDGNRPEDRLAMLGRDIRRLSEKSTEDLLLDYRREVARAHALQLYGLRQQHRAAATMNSANWTGYLERGIGELQGALQKRWSPVDIEGAPAGATDESMIDAMRALLRGFAAGVAAWPSLREAARTVDLFTPR